VKRKGFTLIELLIVIIIIGILVVIVVGLVATNARNRAADAAAKSDLREIQTALEIEYTEEGVYPAGLAGLEVSGDIEVGDYEAGYAPEADGSCYALSYTLENERDSGPNVEDGVYTLVCKQ